MSKFMLSMTLQQLADTRYIVPAGGKQYDFSRENIRALEITIKLESSVLHILGGIWSDTNFIVESDKPEFYVQFGPKCYFSNCTFSGGRGSLVFSNTVVPSISFDSVFIHDCVIQDDWGNVVLTMRDKGISVQNTLFTQSCRLFQAQDMEINKCKFLLYTQNWASRGTSFQSCLWNPNISESVDIRGCQFDDSTVYVGDWVNVCKDKNEVNLLTAKTVIDPWATLREEYTGLRLTIILILTLLFFLPYVIKAGILLLTASIPTSGTEISYVPLWKELFFDGSLDRVGLFAFAQFFFLLVYTTVRFATTLKVSQARDREEHLINSGFVQSRPNPKNIGWRLLCFKPITVSTAHKFLRFAFYGSLLIGVTRLILTLSSKVPVLL